MFLQYPDIKPYHRQRLKVSPPHELYLEESGNPNGIPVLFVHGGPGAGVTAQHRTHVPRQTAELATAQGPAADIGGYFHPSAELKAKVMRPSGTLNAIIG